LINGSANYYGTPYYTPYYTTEVGAYNTTDAGGEYVSDSAYGTFDQGGNVWEWNEAHIYFGVWNRGARGAAMNDVELAMHADFRYPGWQAENTAEIGFRIASSIPEPGSMSLLVCGLAAGLIWWRRRR
jgi:formylglycine-generating enzyme required for sulfatase activity